MSTMESKPRKKLSLFSHVNWEHCVAGVSGGVLSTLVLHPLDLVKVRFQVNEGVSLAPNRPQYRGILDALVTIRRQGGLKGLYQGVTPNVWGAGSSWGLYFLFYNALKQWSIQEQDVIVLSPGHHMLCAAEAGVLTLVLTNPIWVAKTRLCLQYDRLAAANNSVSVSETTYKGMVDCLAKTYQGEGLRGLYRGFLPGLFGVSHGAIQFVAYEELKKMYNGYKRVPLDSRFSTFEYLSFAALSKVFAASVTYPYQVVRSRLQDQHREYHGIRDVVMQTWRREKWRGFFKGLSPYLLHVTPNICIVFLVYEHVTHSVAARRQQREEAEACLEEELSRLKAKPPPAPAPEIGSLSDDTFPNSNHLTDFQDVFL